MKLTAILLLFTELILHCHAADTNRPPAWAQKVDVPGVPNCYIVTTNLYRGAQPTAEGMKQLQTLGIKTVVNLRAFHSDKDELAGTGLKSEHFQTTPWHGEMEDVIRFLKIATDTNSLPIFVHCQRGADRTGMMCAMHRVAVCDWTKEAAIKEMKEGGFDFYPGWENLVKLIEQADMPKIKTSINPPIQNKKSEVVKTSL